MRKDSLVKITCLALFLFALSASGCGKKPESSMYQRMANPTSADSMKLLAEGNDRYVSGNVLSDDLSTQKRHDLSVNGQKPFAVILSCSDSRVPPETVFDQGLGDLFVVRDAGNIADPVVLGSIEYGAEHLKAPLIVVLGHEKCGAVKATVDGGEAPGSIGAIVAKIKPSLDKLKAKEKDKDALYSKVEDENILHSIDDIKKSLIIEELIKDKKVDVVGAKYNIETGKVTFLNAKE